MFRREILAKDPSFREYMVWMGLFGGGNLMIVAQPVVILTDDFGMPGSRQIALLAVMLYCAAVVGEWQWLLWLAALTYGFAIAGANLGWNLGHTDFATSGRARHARAATRDDHRRRHRFQSHE